MNDYIKKRLLKIPSEVRCLIEEGEQFCISAVKNKQLGVITDKELDQITKGFRAMIDSIECIVDEY